MLKSKSSELPLVYSCSGCSNIAQLANKVAIDLDREEVAEMSCIAGVGGGVKSLVNKAKSDRKIIALDGCHLQCVKNCLSRYDIKSTHHYILTEFGIKKKYHLDCSSEDAAMVKSKLFEDLGKTAS